MKRVLLAILPIFLSVILLAQSHEVERDSGPSENGPVIININGNSLNSYEVLKPKHDAIEINMPDDSHLETDAFDGSNSFDPATGQRPMDGFQQDRKGDLSREDADKQEVEEVKSKLRIYPIPAVTVLNIDMGKEVNAELSIMNIIGQDVFSQRMEGSRELQINVSDYPSGSYFVMIKLNGQLITKRVQIR